MISQIFPATVRCKLFVLHNGDAFLLYYSGRCVQMSDFILINRDDDIGTVEEDALAVMF